MSTRPARTCTRCQQPHQRYSYLCAACDDTYAPPLWRCVWPLRCYCAKHKGRPPRIVGATVQHRYAYDVARLLAERLDA